MVVPLKLGKSAGPGVGRRSTRLSIAIPITISGKDASGRSFKENCRTIIINKHGAKILTVHQLALGSEVVLENRALGRTAKTTVVWLGDRQSSKVAGEVGVQLVEAENIWGIDLPPDDWQEGPPIGEGGQRLGQASTPSVAALGEPVAPPPPPPVVTEAPAPPEPPPPVMSPAPTPAISDEAPAQLDAASQASMQRLVQQTEDTLAEHLRQFEQNLTSLAQQFTSRTQVSLQEVATQHARTLEKTLEQQVGGVEQRLQATRAELEALLAKLQELQQSIHSEAEITEQNIQTAGFMALQAASEELNEKVRLGLETATANIGDETRKRVREICDQEAAGAGKAAIEELRAAENGVVEDVKKQLTTLRQQALEGLTQEAKTLAIEYPIQVRKQLQDFQDQRTHELEDHLAKALEKQRQAVLKQVQKVGEDVGAQAVVQVQSKCESAVKAMVEDVSKQDGPAARAMKAWEEQVQARLEAQLSDVSRATLERIRQESEAPLRDLQTRLQQASLAFQEKSVAETEEKIRAVTLKQMEEAAAEFDKRTEENLMLFSEQLNDKKEEIVSEATEMFRITIGQMFLAPQAGAKKPSEGEGAKKRR